MGIGCKWLQLLLICWESGLFSCTYWFSFITFLEGSVLHQLITGTDLGADSCSAVLVTSPRQHLQRSRQLTTETCEAAAVAPLWICLLSSFLSLTEQPVLRMPPRRALPMTLWGEGLCWYSCLSRLCWVVWFSWARNKVVLVTVCWVFVVFYGIVCDPNH